MEGMGSKRKINSLVKWFCCVIILTLFIHVGYFCYTASILTKSQEKIVNEHVGHIAKVDSLFLDMKKIILDSDSGIIANVPALLSQLQKDSALFRREIMLSQEELNNLTELHLNQIGSSYGQTDLWFSVAGVIFIIFGFYGMFKIEESKKHAEDVLNEVKQRGNAVDKQLRELQSQASELNVFLNNVKEEEASFIQNRTTEFDELKSKQNDILKQSSEDSAQIQQLLREFKSKDGQYQITLELMEKQTKQLEVLFKSLYDTLEEIRKEANNG